MSNLISPVSHVSLVSPVSSDLNCLVWSHLILTVSPVSPDVTWSHPVQMKTDSMSRWCGYGSLFLPVKEKKVYNYEIKKLKLADVEWDFIFCLGLHGGVVVSTVASQQEGSRFDPHLEPFCVEFACSSRVCMGSFWILRLPPTIQKHAC